MGWRSGAVHIALETDAVVARQKVHHDAEHPSHLVLPVIPGKGMTPFDRRWRPPAGRFSVEADLTWQVHQACRRGGHAALDAHQVMPRFLEGVDRAGVAVLRQLDDVAVALHDHLGAAVAEVPRLLAVGCAKGADQKRHRTRSAWIPGIGE